MWSCEHRIIKQTSQVTAKDILGNAQYLAITNGLKHYVWKKTLINGKYEQLSEFPFFS